MPSPVATLVGFTPRPAVDVRGDTPWAVDAGLLGLIAAELIALSIAFDTWRLDAVPSLAARIVAWSPQAVRLVLAIAVVALALDGRRIMNAVRNAPRLASGQRLAALVIHLLAIASVAAITSLLVNGDVTALSRRPEWTMAWLLMGVAAIVAWGVAIVPPAVWVRDVRPRPAHAVLGLVVGAAIWASGFVTQEFWAPMARVTFGVVAWTLGFLFDQTVVDPDRLVLGTAAFKVRITAQCSGYEGIGLILSFLGIYLWLFRSDLRFPAAFLLLPMGAMTIWVANAIRIVALIAIGNAGWPAVATGGFHSQAGWIAFLVIGLGFVALTSHSHAFASSAAREVAPRRATDSTIALLAPFVAITATAMVTGAFSAGFDWLYPLRVTVVAIVLWAFRHDYRALLRSWSWSWWPIVIGLSMFVLWLALMPSNVQDKDGWPAALGAVPVEWAGAWMAFRVVGYVLMAPLAEELAFRAFLIRRLQGADFDRLPIDRFTMLSFLGSSLLFGALHGQMWLAGTLAGMAFAAALYRRGALADAVVAHAVTNGALAVYAAATGQWSVWS